MGVKNNFSQAVSELIGISRTTVEPEEDKTELKDILEEEALDMEASLEDLTEEDDTLQNMARNENGTVLDLKDDSAAQMAANPKDRIMAMLSQQQQQLQAQQQPETPPVPQPAVTPAIAPTPQTASSPQFSNQSTQQPKEAPGLTTIAKGTVIIGEINAEGDVALLGSVKGKIAAQGDIRANGKVVGDLIGKDIELIACAVQGNIIASGMVNVDGDSVVIGDVKADNFCLDGKIKGNVTVEKEAKFQPKAILAGNVTTASIAMSQGAKIQGAVNIPLSEKETDMSFGIDINI